MLSLLYFGNAQGAQSPLANGLPAWPTASPGFRFHPIDNGDGEVSVQNSATLFTPTLNEYSLAASNASYHSGRRHD
jgi:hypothetical protein